MEKLLTVTQAAKRMGLSGARICDFIRGGRLPAKKYGNQYLIKATDLKAFSRVPRYYGRPRLGDLEKAARKAGK